MGKRITQQARGKGSFTFRVRRKGYKHRVSYPALNVEGIGKIKKLINSSGHSAPLVEIEIVYDGKSSTTPESNPEQNELLSPIKSNKPYQPQSPSTQQGLYGNAKRNLIKGEVSRVSEKKSSSVDINNKNKTTFIVPAAEGVYEGQEIYIGKRPENKDSEYGDIVKLKDTKQGDRVFNIENVPGKGGKILRSGGCSGVIGTRDEKGVEIIIRRRRLRLNENCRATFGIAAGEGRKIKPFVKAGKMHHLMKSKGRKWHRTSPVKVNAIDHPFGGGRGKRIKSKIAKRNAPAGAKVGHIRPRKTGRGK